MGGSSYSSDTYAQRQQFRSATNTPTFKHTADVQSGRASALHASLNIKDVKVRESRDSVAHPESLAVIIGLDVTGSMGQVPITIQKCLNKLMALLITKGYVPHPHIMVSAVGDARTGSQAPIQVGQFEAGIEIENDLTNLYLEGGGGGNVHESYDLLMYFAARHTSIDCFEKRNKKGYMFIIGDEKFYPTISKSDIETHIGDKLEAGISTKDVIKELQRKYEVFYIMPNLTHYYKNDDVLNPWKEVLGERVLLLDDPDGICELLAGVIAANEGFELATIDKDLESSGTDLAVRAAVKDSLSKVSSSGPVGGLARI